MEKRASFLTLITSALVCLWHDVKLRKTQLEVRSLNVTWRRDLWCHRVIVFWKCVKLLAEQLWQFFYYYYIYYLLLYYYIIYIFKLWLRAAVFSLSVKT